MSKVKVSLSYPSQFVITPPGNITVYLALYMVVFSGIDFDFIIANQ